VNRLLLLSLGSNLENRLENLKFAQNRLLEEFGNLHAVSPILETAAFGVEDHPPYLNQVLGFHCPLSGQEVLNITRKIEKERGRTDKGLLLPRTLDIDILALCEMQVNDPDLIIPHPALQDRLFVLEPLFSIYPDWIHPVFGLSTSSLLEKLRLSGNNS
jgi:2-amino-4-hydroxy-6-hydroxymethyldihydropteridine diphosphokinase